MNFALEALLRVWKPLLAALILGGLCWWIRHGGYVDGEASARAQMQGELDAANARGNLAIEANTALVAVNNALTAAADADRAERARQDEQGAAELARAQAQAAKDRALAEEWRRKAAPILGTDRCKAAKAQLAAACPVENF